MPNTAAVRWRVYYYYYYYYCYCYYCYCYYCYCYYYSSTTCTSTPSLRGREANSTCPSYYSSEWPVAAGNRIRVWGTYLGNSTCTCMVSFLQIPQIPVMVVPLKTGCGGKWTLKSGRIMDLLHASWFPWAWNDPKAPRRMASFVMNYLENPEGFTLNASSWLVDVPGGSA